MDESPVTISAFLRQTNTGFKIYLIEFEAPKATLNRVPSILPAHAYSVRLAQEIFQANRI